MFIYFIKIRIEAELSDKAMFISYGIFFIFCKILSPLFPLLSGTGALTQLIALRCNA